MRTLWNYNKIQTWAAPLAEHTRENGERCIPKWPTTTTRRPLTCHQDEKNFPHKDQVCHSSNASDSTGICRWEIPFSYHYTNTFDCVFFLALSLNIYRFHSYSIHLLKWMEKMLNVFQYLFFIKWNSNTRWNASLRRVGCVFYRIKTFFVCVLFCSRLSSHLSFRVFIFVYKRKLSRRPLLK